MVLHSELAPLLECPGKIIRYGGALRPLRHRCTVCHQHFFRLGDGWIPGYNLGPEEQRRLIDKFNKEMAGDGH